MTKIDQLSVNAIRILAADTIQKAKSGHPGAPLGTAPMMYELYTHELNHNPQDPKWENRDRFILSGGHGSAGLYSLLHLFGYKISMDDLKNFRQLDSLTPGHPEYGHTDGVECTTGPLGSGLSAAVGMAIAEAYLAEKFNRPGFPIVDHNTYVEVGDGDLMEGISQEALSLAGTLKLDKMIILYDSNDITIEGDTHPTFGEDVNRRMEALGFNTWFIEDGNDQDAIRQAIEEAKADHEKPSFITVKTRIGYGSPKEGLASSHGEPLGVENVAALKKNLGWDEDKFFYVPEEVYANFKEQAQRGAQAQAQWEEMYAQYKEQYPEVEAAYRAMFVKEPTADKIEALDLFAPVEKAEATRVSSGRILNKLKDVMPNLIGGSADLGPSNKTIMEGEDFFTAENRNGRNIHFGVRELAMAGICNGLALAGLRPYAGTFFVFSDYSKPMARLAALMNLPVVYVYTHDSIGVGEDGPTHEPIEHLASYRSLPNIVVFRPADAVETAAGWTLALDRTEGPTALILTRQNVEQIPTSSKEALKGAYIVKDSKNETPEAIFIASGSEVAPTLQAAAILEEEGVDVRVVSMPSMELFEMQSEEYRESILPRSVRNRVSVEASKDFGWGRYVGIDGDMVGMKSFGASAPSSQLFEYFGFTKENIAQTMRNVIARNR
ncbi:transketolase [Allobaculum stercoricanis]|uniref:transketolase n=1 Tax=Allobaculum stercoricanis TaxID=174709 RepID=UPI0023F4223F|nr:transketolase [Allobaculum stercoricanis]